LHEQLEQFKEKTNAERSSQQEGEGVAKAQKELPTKSLKYPQKQKGMSIMEGLYKITQNHETNRIGF
jgi:hypothetical protein